MNYELMMGKLRLSRIWFKHDLESRNMKPLSQKDGKRPYMNF